MELLLFSISILFALILFLFSPQPFRRFFRCVYIRLFRRHPAELIALDIDTLGMRVQVLRNKELSRPAYAERVRKFYDMKATLDWDIIAADADVERDVQEDLIEELRQPFDSLRFYCITGGSGSGKSTLARRVAAELHRRHRAIVIRVSDTQDLNVWYRMDKICSIVRKPLYILADDLFHDDGVRRALEDLSPELHLTVLATSQTNEYRPDRLKGLVSEIHLDPPSLQEKEHVLRRLGKQISDMTQEQSRRFHAANEFAVLMVELTYGEGFPEIVEVSLNNLKKLNEPVYSAYEFICFAHSCGIAIPTSVLERLDAMGRYHNLPKREGAKEMIFYDESRPDCLRTVHQVRAEAARSIYESRRPSGFVLRELVRVVDVNSLLERRFLAHLLRNLAYRKDKILQETLSDIEPKLAECRKHAGRISELVIWRTFYRALDRSDEAEQCVDAALTCEPVNSLDYNTLLGIYRERGCERDALPVLERWIQNNLEWGGAGPAYLGLLAKYGAEDDQRRAIEVIIDWLEKHPEDSYLRTAFLKFVENKGLDQQKARVLDMTRKWLKDHRGDCTVRTAFLGFVEHVGTPVQKQRVLEETRRWLKDNKDDGTVRTAFLSYVTENGTPEQKARVIKEMPAWLREHPNIANVWVGFVSFLQMLEMENEAREFVRQAKKHNPDNRAISIQFVKLLSDELDETDVRNQYEDLLSSRPTDSLTRYAFALWLQRHGNLEEAERNFIILIEKNSRFSKFYSGYGMLLLDKERYVEAEAMFRQAIDLFVGEAKAHAGLAEALLKKVQDTEQTPGVSQTASLYIEAEKELLQAIHWASTNNEPIAKYRTGLGWLYIYKKNWAMAHKFFDKAANEDPDYYGNYVGQGEALIGIGQWDNAAQALHTAQEKLQAADDSNDKASEKIRQLLLQCDAATSGETQTCGGNAG